MAYTKAPTNDTHNVQRIPARGSPFLVSNVVLANPVTLSCINCFPLKESMWGTDPLHAIHKREPWEATVTTGAVVGTGTHGKISVQTYSNFETFVAKAASIYSVNYFSNTTSAAIATKTDFGNGYGTNFIDSSNVRRVAFLEANQAGATFLTAFLEDGTSVVHTDLAAISADGAKGLVFIDGYLFAANALGTRIYNSAPGGVYTTWNTTDFLDAEQYADPILILAKHKNYLVALGKASTEFFYDNAVEVGSPLARQESYSTRIGIVIPVNQGGGAAHTNVEDDVYFLGLSESNSISLYRIKDFKVEEIESQYVQGIFNNASLDYLGISAIQVNNNPQIVVEFSSGYAWAYHIMENTWWAITGADFVTATDRLGSPFVPLSAAFNTGGVVTSSLMFSNPSGDPTEVFVIQANQDYEGVDITATYFTEVIDFGINRYKHLARVDAIGDYGTNICTMYVNVTPNYGQTFHTMGSQNQATIGYENNMSWYNMGAPRRFILAFQMAGQSAAIHRAFDIEYNIGAA